MHLQELLSPSDFVVPFEPADKWDAIHLLMRHLVDEGRIGAALASELEQRVLERERSMSTGMERGIAIPHAAVDGIETVVACVGLVQRENGLAFESIDARPARIVVLLLIPRLQKLLHIRTLADIARTLSKETVRAGLREAPDGDAAWHLVGE